MNAVSCGRQVAKLYGPERYFLCRHCCRLTNASHNEGLWDRRLRRANKIRRGLGGQAGLVAPFPFKPKGMWQRTCERLCEEGRVAEERANVIFALRAQKLVARFDKPRCRPDRKREFWS